MPTPEPTADELEKIIEGKELALLPTPSQVAEALRDCRERGQLVTQNLDSFHVSVKEGDLYLGSVRRVMVLGNRAVAAEARVAALKEAYIALAAAIEGLHNTIFGVASMKDPTVALAALEDDGIIHRQAHVLLRALWPAEALEALDHTLSVSLKAKQGETDNADA